MSQVVKVNDDRILHVEFSNGATIYFISETKRLTALNEFIESSGLSYELSYIEDPTKEQRANANTNESSENLVFFKN